MNQYRSPNRGPGGGGRSGGNPNQRPALTPAPAVKFYLDAEKTRLNPELLDTIAEQQAEKMHGRIGSAQLRRFFGEVKELYHRRQNGQPFERLFPLVKMLKSKTWYAANPKQEKIPPEFAGFLLGGIDQVHDEKDFEAFVLYFEAVVGFMYGKGMVQK